MGISVCYDFQIFMDQFYGGISRYIYELALRVNRADEFSSKVLAPIYKNRYPRPGDGIMRGIALPGAPVNRRIYRAVNWIASPLVDGFAGADILHETYYQLRPIPLRRKAVVLTVYDMIHERFHELFPYNDGTILRKEAAIRRADHIICISESTRRDLLEYFDLPELKVSVVHLGFNPTSEDVQGALPVVAPDRPFLLYVGDRKKYKNFEGLLRAYATSSLLSKEFCLVCFGGDAFDAEEFQLLRRYGVNNGRVVYAGYSDEVLFELYRQATLFVCPSKYEGFGIPLLEAMYSGCPVACSNTSSLPEVAGDAAIYFNPHDPESIREVLETLAESDSMRAELTILGRKRASLFSWDKCATETMSLYRRTLGI
jgi:glycosyltransferase involved in cell wall biosynthesis